MKALSLYAVIVWIGITPFGRLSADDDEAARAVTGSSVFRVPIHHVGTAAPAEVESRALLKAFDHFKDGREAGLGALWDFVVENPQNSWTPSLQCRLGEKLREQGRYSKALKTWSEAWKSVSSGSDANSREIAGEILGQWSQLLASLGRLEELTAIYEVASKNGLDLGASKPLIDQTREGVSKMAANPGLSYRCGTYALFNAASQLNRTNSPLKNVLEIPSPKTGFSMFDLVQIAGSNGIPVRALRIGSTDPIPVPSVVHWRESHYAAILEERSDGFVVIDPTFREKKLISAEAIREESSGRFLALAAMGQEGVQQLSTEELKSTFGKGAPNYIDDSQNTPAQCSDDPDGGDRPSLGKNQPVGRPTAGSQGMQQASSPMQSHQKCPPDEIPPQDPCPRTGPDDDCCSCKSGGYGMPQWNVAQPYQTLWLFDTPLFYYNSEGEVVELKLSYKHRTTELPSGTVTGFGPMWTCNWISSFNESPNRTVTGKIIRSFPGGGKVAHSLDGSHERADATKLQTSVVPGVAGMSSAVKYMLSYGRGGKNIFDYTVTYGADPSDVFMNKKVDRAGRSTAINWNPFVVSGNTNHRITTVTDIDGKNFTFYYTNTLYPNLVTMVSDPYGRYASFHYTDGRLDKITDMIGMETTFSYGSGNFITSMTTPYGTTTFQVFPAITYTAFHPAQSPLSIVSVSAANRILVVTPPDGAREMFAYCDTTYEGSQGTQGPGFRSSYHWGRKQFDLLPSSYKVATLPSNFTIQAADFSRAFVREYLHKATTSTTDPAMVSETLGSTFDPIPLSETLRKNQKLIDYPTPGDRVVENPNTAFSSGKVKLVDGISYTWAISRNEWGHVTSTTKYDTAGSSAARTWSYSYSPSDGQRMLTRTAPDTTVTETYGYDTANPFRLASIKDGNNLTTSIAYHSSYNKVQSINYPGGKSRTFTYFTTGDYAGWVNTISETGSGTLTITGYLNGLPSGFTDELGMTVSLLWDNLNRLKQISYPDSTTVVYTYDKLDLVNVKDRLNHNTIYAYNGSGQLQTITDRAGRQKSFTYCTCGSIETITTPQGVSYFYYDELGRPKRTIRPDGFTTTNSYSEDGLLKSITASGQRGVTFAYDADRNLLTKTVNGKGTPAIDNTYDDNGRLHTTTSMGVLKKTYTYDAGDRVTSIVTSSASDSLPSTEGFEYDATGLKKYTAYVDPTTGPNKVTTFIRDASERATSITDPNLIVTQYTYAADGSVLTLTDGLNHQTRWEYDLYGRLYRKYDANNVKVAEYTYNAEGFLLTSWTPAKGTITYTPDNVGFVTAVTFPDASVISYTPDAAGRLGSMTDQVGTTSFYYDQGDRLTSEVGPWPSSTVGSGYVDGYRNSLSITQPTGGNWVQGYVYDQQGRLQTVTDPSGSYTYHYDWNGSAPIGVPSSLEFPASQAGRTKIRYGYDDRGRRNLVELDDPNGAILNQFNYGFNELNQRTWETQYGAGAAEPHVRIAYGYDDGGRLTSALGTDVSASGSIPRPHQRVKYGYDAGGNLTTRRENPDAAELTTSFIPDTVNQLSSASRTGTLTVSGGTTGNPGAVTIKRSDSGSTYNASLYSDGSYALTGQTLPAGGSMTVTATASDAAGRVDAASVAINSATAVSYSYDANGNLLSDGLRTMTYNYWNQLLSATVPGKTMSTFVYDGLGRLRGRSEYKWSGSGWQKTDQRRYLYDGMIQVEERTGLNLPIIDYTRGIDLGGHLQSAGGIGGLLGRCSRTNGLSTFYLSDAGGNIVALFSQGGAIGATYRYSPFGGLSYIGGALADENSMRFASKEYIVSSGLTYFGFRFFDSETSRWINRDPVGESGGLNLYSYGEANPISRVDSFGLSWYDYIPGIGPGVAQAKGSSGIQRMLSDHGYNSMQEFQLSHPNYGGTMEAGDLGSVRAAANITSGAASTYLLAATSVTPTSIGAKCTARLTERVWEHIIERHGFGSSASNAGKFAAELGDGEIRKLIEEAIAKGSRRPNTGGRSGVICEHAFDRVIGTDLKGNPSNRLRVPVSPSNGVITAFPY